MYRYSIAYIKKSGVRGQGEIGTGGGGGNMGEGGQAKLIWRKGGSGERPMPH